MVGLVLKLQECVSISPVCRQSWPLSQHRNMLGEERQRKAHPLCECNWVTLSTLVPEVAHAQESGPKQQVKASGPLTDSERLCATESGNRLKGAFLAGLRPHQPELV
ncbi:hypothetical protein SKAU_G00349450 [Synaphobranchus kaupii]|uniref:Uncharacterized protein n=1 Tax=Synaphobranchus kaupii TaxID=118154 RepID=A0A9Q1EK67_SYNKA|nr:hypothetical protein SKAU_G00349450 [Synaphobranchus kaupii]